MKLKIILGLVHLICASVVFFLFLLAPWSKGDPDVGAFSSDGGAGFGLINVILAGILLVLAVMRLAGKSRVLPGLGVEQLTVAVGTAAFANMFAFIVGWLAVFPSDGTGWALPAAYLPLSLIPQIALLTASMTEPTAVEPLDDSRRRTFSIVAIAAGAGVALFPFLTWLSSGSISLSALDGRSGNPTSGPRFGYILLGLGVVAVVAAALRLRSRGLAEPGSNLLLSHALFALGLTAFVIPLSTLISVFQTSNLGAGIGLWLGLLASAVLIGLALTENRVRGAVGA